MEGNARRKRVTECNDNFEQNGIVEAGSDASINLAACVRRTGGRGKGTPMWDAGGRPCRRRPWIGIA